MKRQLTLKETIVGVKAATSAPLSPNKRARVAPASPTTTTSRVTIVTSASLSAVPPSPPAAAAAPPLPPIAFNPPLTTNENRLLALELASLHPSWLELLSDELRKDYYIALKEFLWKEGVRGLDDSQKGRVFPPAKDIFSWSRYTPLSKVKVVIIGQDPYHDDGQAHGLSFSVPQGIKVPPSLRNIYKELASQFPGFVPPKHGNLISLARSGVLLLNTSLTVTPHKAGSHQGKGWEQFTQKVLELIAEREGNGVVFMAWGAWAEKRVKDLDKDKNLILISPHPSPLSARRGFFGNGHFVKANEWLVQKYGDGEGIEWTKLEVE